MARSHRGAFARVRREIDREEWHNRRRNELYNTLAIKTTRINYVASGSILARFWDMYCPWSALFEVKPKTH